MRFTLSRRCLLTRALVWWALPTLASSRLAAESPKVPDGFAIRLVAAVPAVEFPCQVATAPDGSLFVGEDPMDQVGPADKPIDRILLFRDGKDPIVFADKLNAIFGMVYHDGSLYVMNMPHLTVFKDTDGDGKADFRKEIFTDLGVPAGSPNNFNDHIVSGLKIGIDGYLYVAVGDKGVPKATGPDGRTAQVVGGGVLRCRLDGTGLEVFSTGTRNHLEANLDDRDNLFTYDNTDDGLGWWTRVTHHIDGGYYGYPHDYHTRLDRMLNRMAEYGGGSPCGGVFYGEDAWPEEYRGLLFWAEWGKRKVQAFRFEPSGASFKVARVIDFVTPGGVESFRPLDLALSNDGKTMYVADWSMGGWANKTEKLGRVYAVTYTGKLASAPMPRGRDTDPASALIARLSHPSYHERTAAQAALVKQGKTVLPLVREALVSEKTNPIARRHLVWVVDAIAGATPEGTEPIMEALVAGVADVRAQAARALGERAVPIAVPGLVRCLKDHDPSVRLQAAIALGRIGDEKRVADLLPMLAESDPYVAFAARRALVRIGDWKGLAAGLASSNPAIRDGSLHVLEGVYDPDAVGLLVDFARSNPRPADERARAIAFLAEVDRRAPPWDGHWWGTQPARRAPPERTIAWTGTPAVLAAFRGFLADPSPVVRAAAARGIVATKDTEATALVRARYPHEPEAAVKVELARALGVLGDRSSISMLIHEVGDTHAPDSVRGAALEAVETIGGVDTAKGLLSLLESAIALDRTPRIAAALGKIKRPEAATGLMDLLASKNPAVRGAAALALLELRASLPKATALEASRRLRKLLGDPALDVRKQAVAAMAAYANRDAIPELVALAGLEPTAYEAAMALAAMPDIRALPVYLRGLADKSATLRDASAAALAPIRDQAASILDELASRNELPRAALPGLHQVYEAVIPIVGWRVIGPFPIASQGLVDPRKPIDLAAKLEAKGGRPVSWRSVKPVDERGQINLGRVFRGGDEVCAYGYAELESPIARTARMVVGSDDTLTVWINGTQVYRFEDSRGFEHDQARFDVALKQGKNSVLIRCGNHGAGWQFAAAVAGTSDHAFLKGAPAGSFDPERYRETALKSKGDIARGRALFHDLKGLACVKCHAIGKEGGAVGPELSTVGAKYPREEIIASVLYPSAKISSGFEAAVLALVDGRVVTGIVRGENERSIDLQDGDAKLQTIAKDDIDARKPSPVSLMPSGLAQGISERDFSDLIAYLESLKNPGK